MDGLPGLPTADVHHGVEASASGAVQRRTCQGLLLACSPPPCACWQRWVPPLLPLLLLLTAGPPPLCRSPSG
jgi:hypothetical protein